MILTRRFLVACVLVALLSFFLSFFLSFLAVDLNAQLQSCNELGFDLRPIVSTVNPNNGNVTLGVTGGSSPCITSCDRAFYDVYLIRPHGAIQNNSFSISSLSLTGEVDVINPTSKINVGDSENCTANSLFADNWSFEEHGRFTFLIAATETSISFPSNKDEIWVGTIAIDGLPGDVFTIHNLEAQMSFSAHGQNIICNNLTTFFGSGGSSTMMLPTADLCSSTDVATNYTLSIDDTWQTPPPLQLGPNDLVEVPIYLTVDGATTNIQKLQFELDIVAANYMGSVTILDESGVIANPALIGNTIPEITSNGTNTHIFVDAPISAVGTGTHKLFTLLLAGPTLFSQGGLATIMLSPDALVKDNNGCCIPDTDKAVQIEWAGKLLCPDNFRLVISEPAIQLSMEECEYKLVGNFKWDNVNDYYLVENFNMHLAFMNGTDNWSLTNFESSGFPCPSGNNNCFNIINNLEVRHQFTGIMNLGINNGFSFTFDAPFGCIEDAQLKVGELVLIDPFSNSITPCAFNIEVENAPICSKVKNVSGVIQRKTDCNGTANPQPTNLGIYTDHVESMSDGSCTSEVRNSTTSTSCDVGNYSFCICPDAKQTIITPIKDDDHLNGVNTFDLLLIQKHLLGATLIDCPYKIIAADVNNTASISPTDIIELRKLILGIYSNGLPTNTSWRFFDKKFEFENPLNPFAPPTQGPSLTDAETKKITNYPGIADFWGVKIGDIDNSASVCPSNKVNPKLQTALRFEQVKAEAETTQIGLLPRESFSAATWQMGLDYDANQYELVDVLYNIPVMNGLNTGWHEVEKGKVRLLWFSTSDDEWFFQSNEAVCTLVLKAKNGTNKGKIAIDFDDAILENIAFSNKGEQLSFVQAEAIEERTEGNQSFNYTFEVRPNPTMGAPRLFIESKNEFSGRLYVSNYAGVILGDWPLDVKVGVQEFQKQRMEVLPAGHYFLILNTPEGKIARPWTKL